MPQPGRLGHIIKVEHYQETFVLVPLADVGEDARRRGQLMEVSVQQGSLFAPMVAQPPKQGENGARVFTLALKMMTT